MKQTPLLMPQIEWAERGGVGECAACLLFDQQQLHRSSSSTAAR
jgi:hypothetical protein